ncbi:MAG: SdpI family protein [Firmicutes bacterium]|nr:SdpI family protein [Bacillota bacterium]
MMKENRKTMILTCMLCLLPMALGLYFYKELPEQMPIHWNAAGEVDGYAPKMLAVFGFPVFFAVLELLMFFVILNDPKKQNQSNIMRQLGFWSLPVIGIIVYTVTIFSSLGYDLPITTIGTLLVGVLFIVLGNYMPKAKQNYTIGIKLPWTLDDTENWNKTHRLAGFLWVIGGIVFLIGAFLPGGAILTIAAVLVMVLVPTVYSYLLYQKKK